METKYLFAYGTLQFPSIQKELVGSSFKNVGSDVLDGWKIKQISIEDIYYFTLIPSNKDDKVAGSIFEINSDWLQKLDEFEGDDYKRIEVIADNKRCYMYVDNDEI